MKEHGAVGLREGAPTSLFDGVGTLTSELRPEESEAALSGSQAEDTAKIWGKRESGLLRIALHHGWCSGCRGRGSVVGGGLTPRTG